MAIDTREIYIKRHKSVVAILDWERETPSMTGTLIQKKISQDEFVPFILTNKHVGQLARNGEIKVLLNPDKRIIRKVKFETAHTNLDLALFSIPHRQEDVGKTLEEVFGPRELLDVDELKQHSEIKEGLFVVYLGYPLGLANEELQFKPFIRRGSIANITKDKNVLLIDGAASHGNSGSPVFSQEDGKFIGIIYGFLPDSISLYDDNNKRVAKLPYNSGISLACSAHLILFGIESALSQKKKES